MTGTFGTILALQMGQPRIITALNGVQEQLGYRPILAVQSIFSKVQTTVMFGRDLYGISLMSNLSEATIFTNFIRSYSNRPETWVQLQNIPNPPNPYPNQQYVFRPFVPPDSSGILTSLDGGYDPLRGWWVEFLGNYFLDFPIFKGWPVTRDGPNYRGFQPPKP